MRHPAEVDRNRWRRLRRRMLDKAKWRCQQCGRAGRMEMDHIIPISRPGAHWDESNLQIICRTHHFLKTGAENRLISAERDAWKAIVVAETVKV